MTAQVQSYYADFWQVFGINAIDIWELELFDFIPMMSQVDSERAKAKTEANKLPKG